MIGGALLAASLLTVAAASDAPAAPARFLVVMGHNGGLPDPRPPLHFADDDAARAFQQWAPGARRAWLLTTFDRESAREFVDLVDLARPPTRESLAQVLGEVAWLARAEAKEGHKTELVFAFAGHGDVDDAGEGYVLFADGAFTRRDLETHVLGTSTTDVNHLVIDACSSYFMVPRGGPATGESARVPLTPKLLDVLAAPGLSAETRARTGVLVSTSRAAEVHESSELRAGVFSFLVRSALAGAADSDGDGRVEYAEAAAFVAAASAGADDPRARLTVHAAAPLQQPHAALADLRALPEGRFLVVDKKVHLRVLDAHGVPYAELFAAGDRPVHLALVGAPWFVVRKGDEEAVLVARSAGAYALGSLRFDERPPAARGAASALDPARTLFAAAYGRAFVDGFLSAEGELAAPQPSAPFQTPWASEGSPPLRVPLDVVGWSGVGVGAALMAGAGGAVVMNQLAFAGLEEHVAATGQLDPQRSLEVEGWRNAAAGLSVAGLAVGALGAGLVLWAAQLPHGEAELR